MSDLAAFTASVQADNAAAPSVPTQSQARQSNNGGDSARDSPLPAFTTADFGDFFATTGAAVASAAAAGGDGAPKTGIGARVVSSFTVSDLKSFTEAQAQATAAPVAPAAAPAALHGERVTGIFARPVSSFTVSDLAAFTGGQPAPTATTAPAAAATPASPTEKQVGIHAKAVGSCILDRKALMDATGAWPEVWGPKTDAIGGAYGVYGSSATYFASYAMSGAEASVAAATNAPAAASVTRSFVPTTTGIGAKTLASFTTRLE